MIAPITGTIKRAALKDIAIGLTLGTAAGYYFWYNIHLAGNHKRDAFYAKLEAEKKSA
ncbi:hypothetical protein K493DRAFT_310682 [Basidiobolus meristosporus CBS 931.73]|uniref:Cytochrome c oxidase subunit 9, mitochondrial n=1 Tax=Basidiobolus meristosporus CBS 931.73 TaxID=1314790 RepID=A0A1Y1Z7D8_9FUNG|nr:hypothetical protein K493DRAFT_310682 [Basidiobolus meristosporus CBS 931.73]|eukprot:ORY06180.1 hypothetical protein K493DRAFT_310682 [Basidiobolus meristosporus CBS 931.73]